MGIGSWLKEHVVAGSSADTQSPADDAGPIANLIQLHSLDFFGMSVRSRNGRFTLRGCTHKLGRNATRLRPLCPQSNQVRGASQICCDGL